MEKNNTFATLEQELRIRNYSKKTIQAYIRYNQALLSFCHKDPRAVKTEDIKGYLDFLSRKNASSTVSVAYNAILYYCKEIWHRSLFFTLKHPKKNKYLPVVLSKQEITKTLDGVTNKKHYTVISLLYGTDLRVGESHDA